MATVAQWCTQLITTPLRALCKTVKVLVKNRDLEYSIADIRSTSKNPFTSMEGARHLLFNKVRPRIRSVCACAGIIVQSQTLCSDT